MGGKVGAADWLATFVAVIVLIASAIVVGSVTGDGDAEIPQEGTRTQLRRHPLGDPRGDRLRDPHGAALLPLPRPAPSRTDRCGAS